MTTSHRGDSDKQEKYSGSFLVFLMLPPGNDVPEQEMPTGGFVRDGTRERVCTYSIRHRDRGGMKRNMDGRRDWDNGGSTRATSIQKEMKEKEESGDANVASFEGQNEVIKMEAGKEHLSFVSSEGTRRLGGK